VESRQMGNLKYQQSEDVNKQPHKVENKYKRSVQHPHHTPNRVDTFNTLKEQRKEAIEEIQRLYQHYGRLLAVQLEISSELTKVPFDLLPRACKFTFQHIL
jgi:hypothetical protein